MSGIKSRSFLARYGTVVFADHFPFMVVARHLLMTQSSLISLAYCPASPKLRAFPTSPLWQNWPQSKNMALSWKCIVSITACNREVKAITGQRD